MGLSKAFIWKLPYQQTMQQNNASVQNWLNLIPHRIETICIFIWGGEHIDFVFDAHALRLASVCMCVCASVATIPKSTPFSQIQSQTDTHWLEPDDFLVPNTWIKCAVLGYEQGAMWRIWHGTMVWRYYWILFNILYTIQFTDTPQIVLLENKWLVFPIRWNTLKPVFYQAKTVFCTQWARRSANK